MQVSEHWKDKKKVQCRTCLRKVRLARFCSKAQFLEQPVVGHLKGTLSSNLCDAHAFYFTKFHSLRLSECAQTDVSMFYFSEWMWGEEKRHNQLPPRVLPWVTNWNFWISSARKHDNSQDRCWPDHRTGTSKSSSISRDSLWPIWKKCLQITSAYQEGRLQLSEKLSSKQKIQVLWPSLTHGWKRKVAGAQWD